MANMSASILRNIVASVLKMDSRAIHLSGEISTEMKCENWAGNSYDSRYDRTTIYGFVPETGLVELPTISNGGDSYHGEAPTFGDNAFAYPDHYKDCIFFVIASEGCTQMQRPETWDYYDSTTIFKAPDFKEYFNKIETEEIARWEQWIKE